MRILTRKQVMKRHRELWNKVAELLERSDNENPNQSFGITYYKRKALEELGYKWTKMPKNYCWLCEYDGLPKFKNVPMCANCLVGDWGSGAEQCCNDGSLYEAISFHISQREYKQASEVARKIANLPERTDDE